jgi:hypothetical protein
MNYEQLEDKMVDLLKGRFFEIKPLPDTDGELRHGVTLKPRVWVSYDASDYSDTDTLDVVFQDDKIRIGFDIQAMKRRGENGIFAIRDAIQSKVLGLKLPGYDKMQLVAFTPLAPSSPNSWHYYLQFSTVGKVVENQPDPDENAPLLKTFELVEP